VYRAVYPVGPTTGSTMFAEWMRKSGLAMRDIAAKLGCTEASLRGWASGRRVPTIEFARRIQDLTAVPIAAWVEKTEDE
jgi:transcriptional regulator with XRE-family HTH domain